MKTIQYLDKRRKIKEEQKDSIGPLTLGLKFVLRPLVCTLNEVQT